MSERAKGILILVIVILALAVAAYYATGDRMTIRNLLEDAPETEESINEQATTGMDDATTSEKDTVTENTSKTIQKETAQYRLTAMYPTSGVGYGEVKQYVLDEVDSFQKNVTEDVMEVAPTRQNIYKNDYKIFITDKYVSYKVSSYIYRGGANGIALVKTFVFTKDGAPVTLDEFVPNDKRDLVFQKVEEGIRKVNGVEKGEDPEFEVAYGDIANFYITKDALVIAFDEYSVAPGAAGVVTIKVDRSVLR